MDPNKERADIGTAGNVRIRLCKVLKAGLRRKDRGGNVISWPRMGEWGEALGGGGADSCPPHPHPPGLLPASVVSEWAAGPGPWTES